MVSWIATVTRKLKPRPRYDLDVKALDDRIMARHENTFRALAESELRDMEAK